jgi:hypothetical protein
MKVAQHLTTALRATAVATAVAALAVPTASATTGRVGDTSDAVSRYLANAAAPGDRSDAVSRYVANSFITDTLAPGGTTPSYHFITDTLAPGGGSSVSLAASGDSVSWWDAGVGFSAALVLMGLVLAARFLLGSRRFDAA